MPIHMLIGGLLRRDMSAKMASGKLVRFAVMMRLNRITNLVLLGRNRAPLLNQYLSEIHPAFIVNCSTPPQMTNKLDRVGGWGVVKGQGCLCVRAPAPHSEYGEVRGLRAGLSATAVDAPAELLVELLPVALRLA
jgi:hypothetical protein